LPKKLPMFYSALLLTGVNLLLRFVGTSFQVFLSSRIGAAGIGLLQLVLSVGSLAMIAGIGGIRTATMYLTAEELGKKRPGNVRWVLSGCFLYSISFSCTVSAILYIFAPQIAQNWIGDDRTITALRLFAAFLPVSCLCSVMTGYFTAANRIGTLATVEVAEQALSMTITVAALTFWAGTDPVKATCSVVLGSNLGACLTLCCLIWLRLRESSTPGNRIPVRSRLLQAALPLALADNLKSGINTLENLMVPKRLTLCNLVTNPLAAFGLVSGMVFPVIMFPAAIVFGLAELLIPELARCVAAGSDSRIRYLVQKSLRVVLIYGLLFGGLVYLLAEDVCLRLYRNTDAFLWLRYYALLIPMLYCDAITDAMVKGLGQQRICVRYNIITSVMDVIFLYFLLPPCGMTGYFISFLITHLINFILSLRRLLKISIQHIPFYIPALSFASAIFAAASAATISSASMRCLCFCLIFGSLLFLFRVLTGSDILWVIGLVRKKSPS